MEVEIKMDNDAKKTALRMIPYGIYVLTAQSPDGARGPMRAPPEGLDR